MKRSLLVCFLLLSVHTVFSQCLNITASSSAVSCFNGNDGKITINVTQGVGPFTYELYLFRPGFGQTQMGSVNSNSTTVVFQKGNGTLSALFESTGIKANSSLSPAGNEYRVFVSASGTSGDPFCETLGVNGIIVNEPPAIIITLNDLKPDCDATIGSGNGQLDVSVSGGMAPYTITWTGPSAIPDGTLLTAANLDAGMYTVQVTDQNGCVTALDIDLPVTTQADAGAPTAVTCGVNSYPLAANAPGANEIGTWTGPAGVTFAPDANDPNATANNLGPGANVLRWTITDTGGVCTGTFDEIEVTLSPAMALSATVADALCRGSSTGAIDLSVTGGIAPFTYVWTNGGSTQDITGIPAGTYGVTVSDAAGCSAVLNNIAVGEPATVVTGTTSKEDILCFGATTGSIEITGAGGIGPYDFSIDGGSTYAVTGAADEIFSGLGAGSYDLRVRDVNGCESDIISVTLTQPAAAVSATTTQVDILCFGQSTGSITITGTGGVAPYDFSIDGGTTYAALDAPDQTFPNLAAGPYDLRVRDANGCESALIQVTLDEPADVVSGSTTHINVACFGESTGSITITGNGGVAPYDFSIDGGATYSALDAASHNFPSLPAGAYSLRVRDFNGCESAPINVTIAQPAAALTASASKVDVACYGAATGSITITGADGTAPYDFSIDGGATYPETGSPSFTFTGVSAGTYDLRVRDNNGCETAVFQITVNEPAAAVDATASPSDVSCFGGNTGSIDITGTGGVAPYDFSLDGGATYPAVDAATHIFTNLPADTYDVRVRDANGCESPVQSVVVDQPSAAVDGTTVVTNVLCFDASTGTIEITGTGGVGPYDFSLDGGSTYAALAQTAPYTFTGLAAAAYSLRVRDANGCESGVISVTVAEPAAAVDGTTSQVDVNCYGATTGSITITGTGGNGPYDFSIDGGATYPQSDLLNHTFANLGAGTYALMVRDANDCSSGVIAVTVNGPAAAVDGTLDSTDVTCFGTSTGSITISGTGGFGPYDFSRDGGATYDVTAAATHTYSNLPAGSYNLRVRDANGCESAVLTMALAEPAEVTGTTTAVGPVTVCQGSTLPDITFTFTGTAPYDFTYTDGTTPVSVNDHPAATFTVSAAPAGTYSITALSDNGGCVATNLGGSVTVTEEAAPTVEAGNPQSICSGSMATLSAASIGGVATTGEWSIVSQPTGGDGLLSDEDPTANPAAVTFTASIEGDYRLRLTTDDPSGVCDPVADEVVITVTAAAVVNAGVDQTICTGGTATLLPVFSGTSGITWSTSGDGTFNGNEYTPGGGDISGGTVTLTATTQGPCAPETDQVVITIVPAPTVDAGTPATICSSASVVLSGSFGGSATGLLWTTSGDGSFYAGDNSDPNATYIPGPADATNGMVTLTATATGSCPGTTDNVVITVNPAATVNAGSDQTVCIGIKAGLSATIGGAATTISWSTAGDGSFDDAGDPNTAYTPGAADIAAGSVELTINTNNPAGPCPAATDKIVLTFIPTPGDQTTPGTETWIGYVYDDTGDPTAIPAKINFANSKYRGFITDTDIAAMSAPSTYDAPSDTFDLNLDLTTPLQGTNLCATYLNHYSVRYLMSKTFDAGVYRFTVGADDGVRLLIDGVEVLPAAAFDFQSYTTYTTEPLCISSGVHALEIHYFENTAQSRLSFSYEPVPAVATNSPVAVCINSAAPALTVSTTDTDVVAFNWYKDGALVFTGASYTPAAAELDMTTAATTTFEVAAMYACGEAPRTNVVVDVVDAPVVTANPQSLCESGGTIDLTTLVSAYPSGGTFGFSGHANISGNNFDPAGLAGSAVSIVVDYALGSCVPVQETLALTITNTAATSVPTAATAVCESAADIDLSTLVSASPPGGTFAFSGPQVSGNLFDPSGLSGPQTITVDYNIGGCVAPTATFDLDVSAAASITANNATACESGAPLNLTSLVSGSPAGGTFTFTGTGVSGNFFDPAGQSGTVSISVGYSFNGCTASGSINVTVVDSTDPICSAGNCAAVVIVPKTEPATCTNSDGRLVMSIRPFTPAVNNTGIKITIDGVSSTNLPITRTIYNDSIFEALPVGNYNYSIEYGDPSCVKTGIFSIDQSGTVGTPVVSNIISPACHGTATGSLTLDLPGETGNVLEWSLDGGINDPFKPFTAGTQITGLPAGPAPSYQQVISVRRNAADVCYSSVTVSLPESVPPITATFDITPATCNGNDGAITNIAASGGNDAPFTYSIDGGQTFQSSGDFNNLPGGSYVVRVRDAAGCEADFTADVTFPGFINSVVTKNNADCTNGGDSGSISVMINDAGVFEVALSTDQFNAPAASEYRPYSNPSVTFNGLSRGEYYVYVRSTSGSCPTRSAPIRIFGVYDITFDLQPDCNNNELSLGLLNVTGESGGAPLEIQISKVLSAEPPEIIYQQFPADGEIYLDHDEFTFLQTPGEYRLRIIQFQNEVVCNNASETVDFVVPEPLNARVTLVEESYPDIPSGTLQVSDFTGGLYPYQVRIELDSASSFALPYHATEFEEAGLNENQQIQMTYEGIPAGRYAVEVMDEQGCVLGLVARVPLDVDLYIPNVFTPNGDGSNDVFYIRNLPQEPAVNELVITNRWGKQVFVSENYQNNWDGDGEADGIYFYKLLVGGGEPMTGWIEIIRGQKP